jgi:hypothetical protein
MFDIGKIKVTKLKPISEMKFIISSQTSLIIIHVIMKFTWGGGGLLK